MSGLAPGQRGPARSALHNPAIGSADRAPSHSRVRLSAVLTLVLLGVLALLGLAIPIFMFFAIGAGAGYALSGSV